MILFLRAFCFLFFFLGFVIPLSAQKEKATSQTGEGEEEIIRYLQQLNRPYKKSPTGLYYIIANPGSGKKPIPGLRVIYRYKISLLDGTVVERSDDRGKPITMLIGQTPLIKGMEEAIRLLRPDGKGLFLIPPKLAYGTTGKPPRIGPNKVLVLELEVLDVVDPVIDYNANKQATEKQMEHDLNIIRANLKERGIKARKAKIGVYYLQPDRGNGTRAGPGKLVTIHYTMKILNGPVLVSTYDEKKPVDFVVGRRTVIRGWDYMLRYWRAGGEGTLFIPSPLAYGSMSSERFPANSIFEISFHLLKVGKPTAEYAPKRPTQFFEEEKDIDP